MEIKVFGAGCANCTKTEVLIKEIIAAKGVQATVIKVSDLKDIMLAGVMSTPAVAIDGEVKCSGKVPSKEEILTWFDGSISSGTPVSSSGAGGCSCGGRC